MANLNFDNKLLMQYLSAAGQDLLAGGPIGQNVNAVTQQNIRAQNYMKLLQRMLGGDVPEGGKITTDNKGMKIDVPKSALDTEGQQGSNLSDLQIMLRGAQEGADIRGTGENWTMEDIKGLSFVNPSGSQSGIFDEEAAALAGLTPDDISRVLQFQLAQEELGQQRVTDLVDSIYKLETIRRQQEESQLYDIGLGVPMTREEIAEFRTKDERTAAQKNYEYAREQGFEGTFTDFQDRALTTYQKDYERAKEDGYTGSFSEWVFDLRRAGAINLGEILAREKGKAELEGQLYFKDPDWIEDVSDYVSSEDVQNQIFLAGAEGPAEAEFFRKRAAVGQIERKIKGGGGDIVDVKLSEDGSEIVWTVKWPSGDTETIRYSFGG